MCAQALSKSLGGYAGEGFVLCESGRDGASWGSHSPSAPRLDQSQSVRSQHTDNNVRSKANNQIENDRREEGGRPGRRVMSDRNGEKK